MRALLFFLISFFYLQQCEAQKVVVANVKMNVAYVGVANPLNILVEGYKWDELGVEASDGKITQNVEEKIFDFYPSKQGKAEIQVYVKKQPSVILGKIEFRVKFVPDVFAIIDTWQSGGPLQKNILLNSKNIDVYIKGFDFDPQFDIQNYSVIITRNDSLIYLKSKNIGAQFSDKLKEVFKKTKNGDNLIFFDMVYKTPTGEIVDLRPMNFTIKE